jgi:hypothetical protein
VGEATGSGAWLLLGALAACQKPTPATLDGAAPSAEHAAARDARPAGEQRYLKGQLHLHSNNSGDSRTPPEEVAAWYAARGYDFIVFTDHNRVTTVPGPKGLLVIPGVELTQNSASCDPAPPSDFACLLHVNAVFMRTASPPTFFLPPTPGRRRADLYGQAVDEALARGGLAQLNHPNFHNGANLEIVLSLAARGLTLLEVENRAHDSMNEGNLENPSTEALWDAALTRGARIFGTATDDAHHYGDAEEAERRGEPVYVGDLGFVMVNARKDPAAIRAAIAAGAFYGSTGILLDRLEMTPSEIRVDVKPGTANDARIEVVGLGGAVVAAHRGESLRFDPRGAAGYLRVRVTDAARRKAFGQPFWPSGAPPRPAR